MEYPPFYIWVIYIFIYIYIYGKFPHLYTEELVRWISGCFFTRVLYQVLHAVHVFDDSNTILWNENVTRWWSTTLRFFILRSILRASIYEIIHPLLRAFFILKLLPSGKLSHNYGKSPLLMGKTHYKSPFSIANCWHNQRVSPQSLWRADSSDSSALWSPGDRKSQVDDFWTYQTDQNMTI